MINRLRRGLFVHVSWCLLMGTPEAASARERLAVAIVANLDPTLSDSLTEVAIARLAELERRELVGLNELEANLPQGEAKTHRDLLTCLSDDDCLRQLAFMSGVEQFVIGQVERDEPNGYVLEIYSSEGRTAKPVARIARAKVEDQQHLIAAVQAGVSELVGRRLPTVSAPGQISALPAVSSVTPPLPLVVLSHQRFELRNDRARTQTRYVAYGTAALALLSFSAAVVTGVIASGEATGATRQQAQADLQRRESYAHTTKELLVAGAVLGTASATSFVWYW